MKGGSMNIELTILISIISVSFAIFSGIINLKRNNVTDIKKDAVETATVNVKLDAINRGVEDIKLEQKSTNKDIKDLNERMIVVEQSAKSAHHRIDGLQERNDKI